MTPRKIAVVGGECTGKTTLCQSLAARLPGVWVPEYLREFVDLHGRPPRVDEQASILNAQIEREAAATVAAARAGMHWVACDSAPITTAIYSDMYFGDHSLDAVAAEHHASYALTLLTDIDLAWKPDGLQRDGPQVREQFQARIRGWLDEHRAPVALVSGDGERRLASAIAALRALESAAR